MRNRLLTLLSMAFVAMTSFAQSWTEPVAGDPDTEPSALASEHVYKVRNVESQKYIGGGQVWFSWSTTAMLKELEEDAISFIVTQEEKGWTLKNYGGAWNDCYLFVSGNGGQGTFANDPDNVGFAMHVDNKTDSHRFFEIIDQGDNKYRLRVAEADDKYGKSSVTDWEYKFIGWDSTDETYPDNLHASVSSDAYSCDFEFIDQNQHLFIVKTQLYNIAKAIVDEELNVNYEAYTEVYEGTDYAAIKAAVAALQAQYDLAKVYKVLSVGEDGVTPPSNDNPCNATSLIKNASFDAGNISGWTCTFKGGENATNVGYQGANYTNGDVQISKFIEAWSDGNGKYNPNVNYRALGDGKLSQTMAALPQGKYRFTCDAIAVQQDGKSDPVTGVELFATGGELEMTQAISTENEKPKHFEVTFVSTGGDVEIGLRTVNATANWIAADNFTLTYYGETSEDPAKVLLDAVISDCDEKYDVTDVKANKDVVDAYKTALENAKNAVEDYDSYKTALETAAKDLQTSIDEYAAFIAEVEYFLAKVEGAAAEWPEMSSAVADLYQAARASYYDGTATSESMANFADQSSKAIANYISENVKPGKDVSILLNNQGFATDFSGWVVDENGATPAFGGKDVPLPEDNPVYPYTTVINEGEENEKHVVDGGCAEVYKAKFDISQVIKNMPAGVYTLSCQAFERIEDGDKSSLESNAVLYAVVNGNEQTQKVMNIHKDAQETQLYFQEYGGGSGTTPQIFGDVNSGAYPELWIPNGMCGANVYFRYGLYKNYFDIVVDEQGDITVGIKTNATNGWVLFDDFKIVYKGKEASQLVATIDNLTQQINDAQVNENNLVLTKDVKKEATDAIAAGEAAKADNDFDKSSLAIAALRQALTDVQDNLKFVTEFYNEYTEMVDNRFELDVAYYGSVLSFNGVPAIIDEMETKFTNDDEAFADSADVENYRIELKKAYTQAVMEAASVETANEDGPADVTAAIYNPNSMSYDYDEDTGELYAIGAKGWTVSKGKVGSGNSGNKATEFYQQAFDINQTIYSLTPGYYRVKVNGFYRDGNGARIDSCYNKVDGFEEHAYATLYAGEAKTALRLITEEESMTRWNEYINDDLYEGISAGNSFEIKTPDETDDNPYIPQNAAGAYAAFNLYYEWGEADMWQNILQFKVEEGQESVTIGIRKTDDQNVKADAEQGIEEFQYGDWTIWANWRLEYVGTTEPSTDPTTAIKGVDYVAAPAKAAIYNIAGQRVNKAVKGLYIINGKKYVVK